MKNKILLSILVIVTILTTGCFFKRDEMEDINIITTIYPIEYFMETNLTFQVFILMVLMYQNSI